jgi:hypothetical protein
MKDNVFGVEKGGEGGVWRLGVNNLAAVRKW